MAEGLNRVMLLGNLGADPELRFTQGGQAVLTVRLATTESYLDKDKVRRERTDWHNVVVWGKRGEALGKILSKGSSIFVEGSIRTSSYDDKEGNKRYKTEIIANNVLLVGGRGRGGGGDGDGPAPGGYGDEGGYGGGGYEGGGGGHEGGGGGRTEGGRGSYGGRGGGGGGSYGGARGGGGGYGRGAPPARGGYGGGGGGAPEGGGGGGAPEGGGFDDGGGDDVPF